MSPWHKISGSVSSPSTIKEILNQLAANRGILPEDIDRFYSADLSGLSDPSTLGSDVEVAANILFNIKNKNVAIVGDYDADGILSSAIIEMTVRKFGGKCSTFIPSRWSEGYGLNDKTVKAILNNFKGVMPDALFVLDCGSSSEDQIALLKKLGIPKIIVIDHHIIDLTKATKSADAHINWRRFGSTDGYCAAGQSFQVARRACMIAGIDWKWLLPFAAIATVGDVVPVIGDNRIIVRHGISAEAIMSSESIGLRAIVSEKCRGTASQKSIAFYVVPRINAAGRMGNPKRAFDFIMDADPVESSWKMAEIEAANNDRKALQDRIFRQGVSMVGGNSATPDFVFLHEPSWSIGVCGISCSEMVEKFGVPTMMFGTHDGKIVGSGRSIKGIDIKAVLDGCGEGVFDRYGGHEMACGATIKGGMFAEAQRRFGESLSKLCKGKRFANQKGFDFDISPKMVVKELGDSLMETFYPYCPVSNQEPVFRIPAATIKSVTKEDLKAFIKMSIEVEKDGIKVGIPMSAFLKSGADDGILSLKGGDVANLYFSFPQEKWFDDGFTDPDYKLELVDMEKL